MPMLFELWISVLTILLFANLVIFGLLLKRQPLVIKYGLVMLPATSFACFINVLLAYSQDFEGKYALYLFCVLLDMSIITTFMLMVMEYTKVVRLTKVRKVLPLLVVPALVGFSVITDPWLHSFNQSVTLSYNYDAASTILVVTPSFVFYVWNIYAWTMAAIFSAIMILHVYRKNSKKMAQIGMIVVSITFSSIIPSYFLFGESDIYFNNLAYSLTAFSIFLFSFRYGVFDLVPVARQKMLDVMSDKVMVVNGRSELLDLNQSCLDYLGSPPGDLIGKSLSQVVPMLPDLKRSSIEDPTSTFPHEIIDRSGSTFDVMIREFQYNRQSENGYIIILHDVSERKRSEAILREAEAQRRIAESERRYRTVVDNQTEAIISFIPNGDITFVNKVVETHLGMTGSGLSRLNIHNFMPPGGRDLLEEQLIAMTPSHTVGELEMDFQTHDGRPLDILWRLKGIFRDSELQEVQAVGINITERHQFQRELEKSQRLESLGILAGGIAHDFNNMLASIVGNMEIAKMDLPDKSRPRERMEESIKSAMNARRLTQQLLTFSKGGQPVKEVINIPPFIRSSVQFMLAGSRVEAVYDIQEGLRPICADKIQLEQVLNNLVINAVQAMPLGGHLYLTAQNLSVDKGLLLPVVDGDYVRLDIKDEGTGISKEVLDHIFDPFFTTKSTGTGLGLSSVQSIVRNHGGTILVDTKLGKGTTMSVILPAVHEQAPEPVPEVQTAARHASGRVLVMDDEEAILDMMEIILKDLGYEPTSVADGEGAISAYRTAMTEGRPFKAVVMDLTIRGGMGGKEAVQGLLAMDPQAKVMVSSGYSDDPIMAHPQEYGFVEVLQKPFTMQDLSVKLSGILS